MGINSLSRVCFSLIITCHSQWFVFREQCTPINSHIDLCVVCIRWNMTSLTLTEFGSTLFTRHSRRNMHLPNAVRIEQSAQHANWSHRGIASLAVRTAGKKESVPHNGRINHGNHIDPPITLQGMGSPATLWGVPIDLQSFFQIQFLKKHSIPVFATSREVKQKFLVIWEGLEPWCFLSIFCFSPHPSLAIV